ncbi:hypothetical protein TREMEDRAFT_56465 [Tremella mesenterica DSM 1558]|uniref:uncharacterized protein n=1 Tax=Tremella mesenterica (strain ATCC 24925 / CBS 8224 / DSM 1558 / NBRC 9311 / NRRL Y-6157 / RJB 2259-6 / UBC 559-6) TaxID=578456 RepID=UPI0003F49F33|nr:uncharacterized protein TREMEDRAFT_56465 [Tremella mesenterica DSM 1558]EIW71510.1 hypothetical protein TREMEDRAFT_56465 [Tremella mesenterica DSM 1558]
MWPFSRSDPGPSQPLSPSSQNSTDIPTPSNSESSKLTTSSDQVTQLAIVERSNHSNSSEEVKSDKRNVKSPLNIPQGNSTVIPDTEEEDKLTGDKLKDYKTAISRIDIRRDLRNIDQIPCARTSFLYGIAGGSGIGAVRYLGGKNVRSASHWAVFGFITISVIQWELCNRARAKELQRMRTIQEHFPHRHISKLKRKEDAESESK